MTSPTDPLAPFRARASPEQRAACLHPPDDRAPISGDGWLCGLCGADCAPPDELMSELTDERLDEVDRGARDALRKASKATAGPWKATATQGDVPVVYTPMPEASPNASEVIFEADWGTGADAAFAADARENVPVLAAAVLALSSEVRALRSALADVNKSAMEARSLLEAMGDGYRPGRAQQGETEMPKSAAATDGLTAERLDEVERLAREAAERASKATPGPWGHKAGALKHYCFSTDEREDFGFSQQTLHWEDGHEVPAEANCVFVAHAREDVPVLAAAVADLAAEVRRLRLHAEAPPAEDDLSDLERKAAEAKAEGDRIIATDDYAISYTLVDNDLALLGEDMPEIAGGLLRMIREVRRLRKREAFMAMCLRAGPLPTSALASGEPPRAGEESGDG